VETPRKGFFERAKRMKVKALRTLASGMGSFRKGVEYDLPEAVATEYIRLGYAEAVDVKPTITRPVATPKVVMKKPKAENLENPKAN
jgi:hypothetical protein